MVAGIIFHDEKLANNVVVECVKRGIMVMNTWSTSIKLGPPLTITKEAIQESLDVIEKCIVLAQGAA